ncbi:dihydroxyacetone kinase subunit DhaK [Oscillospiraceae bacterium MB08-C2-2]|nr:dihydroxyacetone kinase subunit DhaK [Oscillospiraceae bacterium MB08-C2-2]
MKDLMGVFGHRPNALEEALDGIQAAQPGIFERIPSPYSHTLFKKYPRRNRVQVVISGGGSHGPLFTGFVGEGLADGACSGDFANAPNAYTLYEVAKRLNQGKGILFLTNNFAGDFLNNDMAQELLAGEGIPVRTVYATDDLFSARGEPQENRGGLCGIGLLIKLASAAADTGAELDEVFRIVEKGNHRLRSVSVQINPQEQAMEFGAGFSGEKAPHSLPYQNADQLTSELCRWLTNELEAFPGSRYHLAVNRMQQSTYLESAILTGLLKTELEQAGHLVAACSFGAYFNAFNATGFIVSLLAADAELDALLKPAKGYDFTI